MATLALTAALTFGPVATDIEPPCPEGLSEVWSVCVTDMARRWIPAKYLPPAPPPISVELVGEPLIRQLVETYFHPDDWDAAMRVADCESGYLATARNPRSTATGTWQFLKSTWGWVAPKIGAPGWPAGALDPEWSTRGAAWLWYNVGPWQWVCW